MPADVESPMYATASQEVRVADAALGDEVAGAGAGAGGAAGASSVESLISSSGAFSEGGGNPLPSVPMRITPARPAPANVRTLSAPTKATRLRRRTAFPRHPPDRACAQNRPRAPRRIGSSTNLQDRAATAMVAPTWRTYRGRFTLLCTVGVVSTISG